MFFLVVLDLISVFFAFHFSMLSRYGGCHNSSFWYTFGFLCVITFCIFLYQNLYDRKRYVNQTKIFLNTVLSSFYVVIFYILMTFFTKLEMLELSRIVILIFLVYFLTFNIVLRFLLAPFAFEKWFGNNRRRRSVEVSASKQSQKNYIRRFLSQPIHGFRYCDKETEECTDTAFVWCHCSKLGDVYKRIRNELDEYPLVEAVIPAFKNLRMEFSWARIDGKPIWEFSRRNSSKLSELIIRIFDIIGSLLAISVFGIPMLVSALIIRIESGSPILFKQERIGKDGKPFIFLKFRSMKNGNVNRTHESYMKTLIKGKRKGGEIFKTDDDKRITRFGRFLRKTSFDEMPQFFNVLKGDMSIVGPRPPISYEVEMYEDWHKDRMKIKPGITGAWQVFGRSSLPFDKSVFLDLYYVKNRSILLNLYLCLKTIPRILTSVGAE